MKGTIRKISSISAMHFIKLAIRLALFALVLVLYIVNRAWKNDTLLGKRVTDLTVLGVIFGLFLLEMVMRFFPSKIESKGCQKQFKKCYEEAEEKIPHKQSWKRTFAVIASWLILNGAIGALYFCRVIDKTILILISLGYSACDMICILFFCPFQVWIMKNKCCTTCRIYNWDFAMMFTPLVFVKGFFTWGLVAVSLALLLQWEILYRKYPERFTENTNQNLACASCKEKLCSHKKHIRKFIRSNLKIKLIPDEDMYDEREE